MGGDVSPGARFEFGTAKTQRRKETNLCVFASLRFIGWAVLLGQVRLIGLGPFEDLTIPLTDGEGAPRRRVVLFGGEGVGKTSILSAIASTRPGHAVAQLHARGNASPS